MNHHVVIIPGLADSPVLASTILNKLKKSGFIPHIHIFGWTGDFEINLNKLINHLHTYKKTDKVSLIGLSAGGSASLNALLQLKNLDNVITVCSRLNLKQSLAPDLIVLAHNKTAYKKSVESIHKNQKKLINLKEKVLNIAPLFDEIVPVSSQMIPGLNRKKINSILHIPSIYFSLNSYFDDIVNFLKN